MKATRKTKGKAVKDLSLKKSAARAVKGGLVHESVHASQPALPTRPRLPAADPLGKLGSIKGE
jgi:hypothetical protein